MQRRGALPLLWISWGEGSLVLLSRALSSVLYAAVLTLPWSPGLPFSRSQCLLPLLDTPLLSWTLECLETTGVQQVFIFVRDGVEEVRAWLA